MKLSQVISPFLPTPRNTPLPTNAPDQPPAKLFELEGVFGNLIGAAIGLAGIALFIMLLVGGFKYISAGGEAPKVEAAKKTITYAFMGLIFIALAYLLLRVIASFTGVQGILEFKIFQP